MGKYDYEYYKSIGFMCGLEIHQRLATAEKLFCSCKADISEGEVVGEIERKQRAVAGELGDVDRSAKFEETRDRRFIYEIHSGHACLVDVDEEPPHRMNDKALQIALAVAASMDMKIGYELEPMRKEVVDGSNPSAFQRSTLVGINGRIDVDDHAVEIPSMFIEEESAGIIESKGSEIKYDTSRIGIPLVEIDTFPYIRTPGEAKVVALYIGTLLRLTGNVQRGIGSIRQDVNVSIRGGSRIEIKGLQELYDMDKFIENEVERQKRLLEIAKMLKDKSASVSEPVELTGIFHSTGAKLIRQALDNGGAVEGFKLSGFAHALGMEVNPNRRLGSEISDYAKMAGVRGLIHSDEDMGKYGISEEELAGVAKRLGMLDGDAFILIAAPEEQALKASRFAIDRAKTAIEGIPPETRAVDNRDFYTTKFLRPLPGGSRMYPETDAKPMRITQGMLDAAESGKIDINAERRMLEKELGSDRLAEQVMISPRLQLYKEVSSFDGADKALIANVLLQRFTELKRDGIDVEALSPQAIKSIFELYSEGRITKAVVDELLRLAVKNVGMGLEDIIKANKLMRIKGNELVKLLESEGYDKKMEQKEKSLFIKRFMSKYRLNVDGTELSALVA